MSYGHRNPYDSNQRVFDVAIRVIEEPWKFITNLDIPYLGGSSKDRKHVYRDRQTPSGYTSQKTGKWVDTDKYIRLHEIIEKILLDTGMSYLLAHQFATQIEYAAVKADGHDLEEYDQITQAWCKEAALRECYHTPSDIEDRPYIECKDQAIIDKMIPVKVEV